MCCTSYRNLCKQTRSSACTATTQRLRAHPYPQRLSCPRWGRENVSIRVSVALLQPDYPGCSPHVYCWPQVWRSASHSVVYLRVLSSLRVSWRTGLEVSQVDGAGAGLMHNCPSATTVLLLSQTQGVSDSSLGHLHKKV